jgi:peptidoglycan hydrolase-like protein with peptidoglycan-binding domain
MSNDRLVIREPRLDLGTNREVPRNFTGEQAYDWLAIHHPRTNADAVRNNNPAAVDRPAAVIDGELEAVRTRGDRNGIPLVMKDLIFETTTGNKSVMIPNPVQGYVEFRNDGTNAISIWSKPLGSPDNELVGQVLHGARGSSPYSQGDFVPYGAPLVRQSDVGSPSAVHAHIEVEPEQFKRYLGDILSERINTRQYPATNGQPEPARPTNALADGKLSHGEYGPDVEKLQRALNAAGARDARGNPLDPDKDFGDRTREAVENYERMKGRPVTGVANREMLTELGVIQPTQQQGPTRQPGPTGQATPAPQPTPTEQQKPAAQTNPYGYGPDNPLGRLIGSGEGGYNSYNRGVAGDARGAQIDFSQMTVAEVMRRQDLPLGNPDRLLAVGKYQFVPDTLEETVRALGIDRNAKFTPQLQEKMFADYLIDEKRPEVKAYITGKTGGAAGLDSAQHALALEFASIGTPRNGGRGVYDGDSAGNLASISPAQTERVLKQMREQYQKNVQAGMNPDEAYRALSGDPNKYSRDSGAVNQGQGQGRSGGLDDTLLLKGERGEGVLRLQRALNEAGIRDDQGRKLPETGNFLDLTEAAVRKYQAKMGLQVDGDAGEQTLRALGIYPGQQKTAPAEKPAVEQTPAEQKPVDQKPADQKPNTGNADQPASTDSRTQPQLQGNKPTIADPSHPDHRLYAQALSNLEQLGPSGGFKSREEMERAAAAVAADAKATGLSEINHISRATTQSGQTVLIAVQGDPTSPASKNAYIDYNQATSQSIEQSTRMAEAANARQNTQPQPEQQQNQTQQQDPIRLAAAR